MNIYDLKLNFEGDHSGRWRVLTQPQAALTECHDSSKTHPRYCYEAWDMARTQTRHPGFGRKQMFSRRL
jgi:hypothetical protein